MGTIATRYLSCKRFAHGEPWPSAIQWGMDQQRYTTIDEIRRKNLGLLIKGSGTQRGLADAAGISPAQISQWVTAAPDSKTGKPRVISDESARLLESAAGKPLGWMDHEHGQPPRRSEADQAQTVCPLPNALDSLGSALSAAPPSMRDVISTNLAGWARAGGAEPWRAVVLSLLSGPFGKLDVAA